MLNKILLGISFLLSLLIFTSCTFTEKDNKTENILENENGIYIYSPNDCMALEIEIDNIYLQEKDINTKNIYIIQKEEDKTILSLAGFDKINKKDEILIIKNDNINIEDIKITKIIEKIEEVLIENIAKRTDVNLELLGDYNFDGQVDIKDFTMFKQNYGKMNSKYDLYPSAKGKNTPWNDIYCIKNSSNNVIDINDLIVFVNNYAKSIPLEKNVYLLDSKNNKTSIPKIKEGYWKGYINFYGNNLIPATADIYFDYIDSNQNNKEIVKKAAEVYNTGTYEIIYNTLEGKISLNYVSEIKNGWYYHEAGTENYEKMNILSENEEELICILEKNLTKTITSFEILKYNEGSLIERLPEWNGYNSTDKKGEATIVLNISKLNDLKTLNVYGNDYTISGMIIKGDTGEAFDNGRIRLYYDNSQSYKSPILQNGNFSFINLKKGVYVIAIDNVPGYRDYYMNFEIKESSITQVYVSLERDDGTFSLEGSIAKMDTGDFVNDGKVKLYPQGLDIVLESNIENGKYQFFNLGKWDYIMRIEGVSGYEDYNDEIIITEQQTIKNVMLSPGENTYLINLNIKDINNQDIKSGTVDIKNISGIEYGRYNIINGKLDITYKFESGEYILSINSEGYISKNINLEIINSDKIEIVILQKYIENGWYISDLNKKMEWVPVFGNEELWIFESYFYENTTFKIERYENSNIVESDTMPIDNKNYNITESGNYKIVLSIDKVSNVKNVIIEKLIEKKIKLEIYSKNSNQFIKEITIEDEMKVCVYNEERDLNEEYYIYSKAYNYYTDLYICKNGESISISLTEINKNMFSGVLFANIEAQEPKPINSTNIKLFQNGLEKYSFITDEKGRYEIDIVKGEYNIVFNYNNYGKFINYNQIININENYKDYIFY